MKKKLILCVLICITSYSYAQFIRDYSIVLPNYSSAKTISGYSLHFVLSGDSSYRVGITDYNQEIIISIPVSDGNYEIKNDTILLTDSYTHYQLLYQLDSTSLYPIKTYPFMKEMVLKDYYKFTQISKHDYEEISIEKIVNDFEIKHNKDYDFEEGIYVYDIWGPRFELRLKSNKMFEFSYKEEDMSPLYSKLELYLIFFTGTWERKGNVLLLWNTNLEHQFYGLIREDGIKLLFFRWLDMIFTRKYW